LLTAILRSVVVALLRTVLIAGLVFPLLTVLRRATPLRILLRLLAVLGLAVRRRLARRVCGV